MFGGGLISSLSKIFNCEVMNANSTPRELECKSLPHCVNSRINICRRIWRYHSNAY